MAPSYNQSDITGGRYVAATMRHSYDPACRIVAFGLHSIMVDINPQRIDGNWLAGIALDLHTTSSTPIGYNEAGHMQFENVRPPVAECLYQLKYKGNQQAAHEIITAAVGFLWPYLTKFEVIIPVPPSAQRAIQPVLTLARGIGLACGKPVNECVAATRPTAQLKGITDPDKRKELVAGLYAVDPLHTRGRNVLLFDDLFRSGTTMNAITDLLLGVGQAASVRALTITRTRSNR